MKSSTSLEKSSFVGKRNLVSQTKEAPFFSRLSVLQVNISLFISVSKIHDSSRKKTIIIFKYNVSKQQHEYRRSSTIKKFKLRKLLVSFFKHHCHKMVIHSWIFITHQWLLLRKTQNIEYATHASGVYC